MRTEQRRLVIALIVAAAVIATVAVLILKSGGQEPSASTPPSTSAAPPPGDAVLAVKIDNVAAARPQTGLSAADTIYVEPVEGGLTRLLTIFRGGRLPEVIGPVRSARRTDIELLAQYGRPVLAYSGTAPEAPPALRGSGMINASPAEQPGAYYRDGGRGAPHNLFLRPHNLPAGGSHPFVFTGPALGGGSPAPSQ